MAFQIPGNQFCIGWPGPYNFLELDIPGLASPADERRRPTVHPANVTDEIPYLPAGARRHRGRDPRRPGRLRKKAALDMQFIDKCGELHRRIMSAGHASGP